MLHLKQDFPIRLHIDEFSNGNGAELVLKRMSKLLITPSIVLMMEERKWLNQMLFKVFYLARHIQWDLISGSINQCIENEQPWTISTDFNPNCRILSLPSIASICVQRLGVNPLATLCAAQEMQQARSFIEQKSHMV